MTDLIVNLMLFAFGLGVLIGWQACGLFAARAVDRTQRERDRAWDILLGVDDDRRGKQ